MLGSLRASEITEEVEERPELEETIQSIGVETTGTGDEMTPNHRTEEYMDDNGIMNLESNFLGEPMVDDGGQSEDTMSEFSHDDVEVKVKEKGSLMMQGDEEVDAQQIVEDCARDSLPTMDLFEVWQQKKT